MVKFGTTILLGIFFSFFVFLIFNIFKSENISFPIPSFLTLLENNQVTSLNLWSPSKMRLVRDKKDIKRPDISAKSALVYDLTASKILYEKNSDHELPIASLTKIMTAVIAIENYEENEELRVTKENLVGENSMGLSEGEILSVEKSIYGLILPSGNDAAEVLASNYKSGKLEFVKDMNNKAKSLGAFSTNLTNPTGLMGDGDQYSTAFDLLIITKYALQFPLFRKVVSTFEYNIPYAENHKEFYLQNETNLLTSYPGVLGVKTGYTPEAEFCLVTYLDYQEHEIIGIILGSTSRREEMKELLDYSLNLQGITPPSHE